MYLYIYILYIVVEDMAGLMLYAVDVDPKKSLPSYNAHCNPNSITLTNGATVNVPCTNTITYFDQCGHYALLMLPTSKSLTLCEVEIFAYPCPGN